MIILVPSSSFGTCMKSCISMGEVLQGCMDGTSLQPGQADRGVPIMRLGCRLLWLMSQNHRVTAQMIHERQ